MHQYKIIARIFLILPIINLAFALPIVAQETRPEFGDVVPDPAITMLAKRGDEIGKGMYFGGLSGKPDSVSVLIGLEGVQPEAPGSVDPLQMGTSEIQQVSPEPELSKSPSLDHYLESPVSEASLNHYLEVPESETSFGSAHASDSLTSTDYESGSSSSMEVPKFKFKSFLKKVFSKVGKLKFWRRIFGAGTVKDAVNVAQRSS